MADIGAENDAQHGAQGGVVEYLHRLVEATLTRLGDAAAGLGVLDIDLAEPSQPPRPGLQVGQHLRITIGPTGPDSGPVGPDTVGVHFSLTVPREQAVVAVVEQIQDHVIEGAHGAAVPACPGHHHPLQPAVLDAVPSWVCPRDPAHHAEPILPP